MEGEYGFEVYSLAENAARTKRSADDYKTMPEHQRAFYKCEMYIGSRAQISKEEFVYDFGLLRYISKVISVPDALERLILEILSNAADNVHNSRYLNVDPGQITVNMDTQWISIKSEGEPIPIVPKPEISTSDRILTTLDLIFGVIGSSSNYDANVTRTTAGVNGLGAKLCNIFSQRFIVTVGDNKNGVLQTSEWSHNMTRHVSSIQNPPYIWNGHQFVLNGEKYTGPNFVEVKFKLDLRPFNYTELPAEFAELTCRHLLDISFTGKVPVMFNNLPFDARKISDYLNLLYPKQEKKNYLIHFDFNDGMRPLMEGKKLEELVAKSENVYSIPVLEVCVVDTPDQGIVHSFVNGMVTRDGGSHVESVMKVLSDSIKDFFKGDKSGAGDKITLGDIRKHLTLIINCRIGNPQFNSQSKTALKSPKPKSIFTELELKCLKKWDLMDALYNNINAKLLKDLKKTDGKNKRHVSVDGGEDANWAGTPRRHECTLMIAEGQSAAAYLSKYIIGTSQKRDAYGSLAIRGKLLNVTDAPLTQIIANEEIADIKEMLGLREDANYLTQEGINTLRYGMVCCCCDSDVDGQHITALIINFFHRRFPTFLASGRFCFLLTPIIRIASKKGNLHRFYNLDDFEKWRSTSEAKKKSLEVKYFKGLGSTEDADIKEDIYSSAKVICVLDEQAPHNLDIAFKGDMADKRKEWIQKWRDALGVHNVIVDSPNNLLKYINISDFINTKLVEYSVDTFSRSLPSFRDGLKKSQRQVLYYMLNNWDYGKNTSKKAEKVQVIAAGTVKLCHYQHGDASLSDTLIKMVQNYPGSNNLNLFYSGGQFGTRTGNKYGIGKDNSAPRYIGSMPEWSMKYIFKKELIQFVCKNIVEDHEAEPLWIPCDIPLHVINGALGISTAYSVFIPSYHPIDVINWILGYLKDRTALYILPWFKGFIGNVEVLIKRGKKQKDETFLEEDEIPSYEGLTLKTEGIMNILREEGSGDDKISDIQIDEIPIGVSIYKYKKWLEEMIKEKKIDDLIDKSVSVDTPTFIIRGWKGPANKKTLKLIKCQGMSNISLIDDKAIPIPLKSINEVMQLYCDSMIELYTKYHDAKLTELKKEVIFATNFLKLIILIVEEKILIRNIPIIQIMTSLQEYEIPVECYDKVTVSALSTEGIAKHQEKLDKLKTEYEQLFLKSPVSFWEDSLIDFRKQLLKRSEYIKLPHHVINQVSEEIPLESI